MKYFKAEINIVEGEKVYGRLPKNFAIGYESENEAYIEFQDEVDIPVDSGLIQITKQEFDFKVSEINNQISENRKLEEQAFLAQIQRKLEEQELMQNRLKATEDAILAVIMNGGI